MEAARPKDRQYWQRVDELFNAVIETPPRERAARLEALCGSDASLRADVSRLLASDGRLEAGFLEPPAAMPPPSGPAVPGATADGLPIQERPGAVIGPYTLHEQIGEGGFGVVYLAEQHRPVRRRVALKIIKPGMDTRQVVARFQAERQALALMDHPHIARVLDGGETESGRPYFVMELVKGIPITEYCDQCSLSTRQRLELFIPVCQAVQHAHQKGIIHRDLKPSNVMIAMQDGQPAPKVIDFGVAKAINQRLTEHTVYTQFAQLVGTPLYMSPEQAEMSPLEVDTRSDIYSLGALLYELLTGTTPFERERLKQASFDDLRRIIRQEEPPTPSGRLSTLGDRAAAVAQHRRTDPRRLHQLVRGDLDWIVMKALEKDRTRRYETASAFGADVQRCLDDEPVQARPPSIGYRWRKFARRNRVALTSAVLVVATVVVGLAVSTFLIAGERDAARASAEQADRERDRAEDNLSKARDVVDGMLTRVADDLWNTPHMTEFQRELYEEALEFYEGFLEQKSDDPAIRHETARACLRVAMIHTHLGNQKEGLEFARRAVAISEQLTSEHPDVVGYRTLLADSYHQYANPSERGWLEELEIWQELAQRHPDVPEYRRTLATRHVDVGNGFKKLGKSTEAEPHFREALAQWEQFRRDFPDLPIVDDNGEEAHAHHWLANVLLDTGRFEEAETHLRRTVEIRTQLVDEKPNNHSRRQELGHAKQYLGRALLDGPGGMLDEAEQQFQSAVEIYEPLVQLFPAVPRLREQLRTCYRDLSRALGSLRRFREAEEVVRKAIALPLLDPSTGTEEVSFVGQGAYYDGCTLGQSYYVLGTLAYDQGRMDEATDSFREALRIFEDVLAEYPEHVHAQDTLRVALVRCPLPELRDAERVLELCDQAMQRDPRRADRWNDRALALYSLGRWDEAVEAIQKSVSLGIEYPSTMFALRELALALHAKGDVGQTEALLREQLARSRELLGDGHPQTVEDVRQLAKLLYARGEFADAEALLREELAPAREELGDEHLAVGSLLGTLTETLLKQGKYDEAETVVRECLAIRQRVYSDDHPDVWLRYCAVSMLGGALAGQAAALVDVGPQEAADLFAEAEPLLLDGYDGMKDDPRIAHPSRNFGFDNIGEALQRIVQLYEAWDTAEPGRGHADRASKWRAVLEQWRAST